jgi:hypothetical protein
MDNLLQQHTIDLYDLKNKQFEILELPARELVFLSRFDLFAKMAYIKYQSTDPEYARKIYGEHITAFNPDLKEPGRDDKNGLQDFITTFDALIFHFRYNDFDRTKSLIPVSEEGEILDGSHRVAALAFFDKNVNIIKFKGVQSKTKFNYLYFLKRGLSVKTADAIAYESLSFKKPIYIACLWPKMGNTKKRAFANAYFSNHFDILYVKNVKMTLDNLSMFMYEIYKHQDWVGSQENNFAGARDKALKCFGADRTIQFIVFTSSSIDEVIKAKENIRLHYQIEKHALHITDNTNETKDIFNLILTDNIKKYTSGVDRFSSRYNEFKELIKNVYLIHLKVKVAAVLKSIGLYR